MTGFPKYDLFQSLTIPGKVWWVLNLVYCSTKVKQNEFHYIFLLSFVLSILAEVLSVPK